MSYHCKLFNFRRKLIKYKDIIIIKMRLPEIQLLAPTQLKFSIVRDHDEPTILLFETLFCMWECFNMGTELPTKVMLGQTLVLMQMTFLNNVRKVGRLVLSRTFCLLHFMAGLIKRSSYPDFHRQLLLFYSLIVQNYFYTPNGRTSESKTLYRFADCLSSP
jgi:hypothetical protein